MGFIVQKVYHDGVVAFQPRSQGSLRENPGNEVGSFNGYGMVDMGGLLNLHESNVSYNRINSHKTKQ